MNNLPLDKAVEIIFNQNANYKIEGMSLNGIESVSDAFWFITKLFKEGITYTFKDENGNVDLDSLTTEDFEIVNRCMHRVGVNVELQVAINDDNSTNSKDVLNHEKYIENSGDSNLNVGMSYLIVNNDPSNLENHLLILYTRLKKIIIGYSFLES